MGVAECVKPSPRDSETRGRSFKGGVYDHIQPTDSSDFAGEPWSSSSSSSSSLLNDDSDYPLHVYQQTSHQCCCSHSLSHARAHDDSPSGRRRLNRSSLQPLRDSTEASPQRRRSSSPMTSGCTNTDDSSRARCRRRKMTPFLWPCVVRAAFLFVVLMSCLGVNWARPASGLSEHEKHYRDLQSRAVVSTG